MKPARQYVMVGMFIAVMIELCGIKALAFAIGLYLPLATTLPIFLGGALKGYIDWRAERKKEQLEDGDLSKGNLFATGLIAGGALSGVIVAVLAVFFYEALDSISIEHTLTNALGDGGYQLLGALCFVAMGVILYRNAVKKD